jgi:hypothetical protein
LQKIFFKLPGTQMGFQFPELSGRWFLTFNGHRNRQTTRLASIIFSGRPLTSDVCEGPATAKRPAALRRASLVFGWAMINQCEDQQKHWDAWGLFLAEKKPLTKLGRCDLN